MTDRYAVIGNPIEHSKSPQIHTAFAQQTGEDLEYVAILGNDFKNDVTAFIVSGGSGLNITVPFKQAAWQLVDERSGRAEMAGAVNTISLLPDGRLSGDNTDGAGLVTDLCKNHNYRLAGSNILLLGAGGAARGVLRPLLESGPDRLTIANRTASKAIDLATAGSALGTVEGCGLDALAGRQFDLIINATSSGLDNRIPQLPDDILKGGGWVYDMMYGNQPTAFVLWGEGQGAVKALDGLGMLVEQAAESFFLWRGVRPDTAPVIQLLRSV